MRTTPRAVSVSCTPQGRRGRSLGYLVNLDWRAKPVGTSARNGDSGIASAPVLVLCSCRSVCRRSRADAGAHTRHDIIIQARDVVQPEKTTRTLIEYHVALNASIKIDV